MLAWYQFDFLVLAAGLIPFTGNGLLRSPLVAPHLMATWLLQEVGPPSLSSDGSWSLHTMKTSSSKSFLFDTEIVSLYDGLPSL